MRTSTPRWHKLHKSLSAPFLWDTSSHQLPRWLIKIKRFLFHSQFLHCKRQEDHSSLVVFYRLTWAIAGSAHTQSCLLLQALTPCHIPVKRPVTFTPQVLTLSWHLCWGNVGWTASRRKEETTGGWDELLKWKKKNQTWPPLCSRWLWWCFYCEKIWLFLCSIIMSAVQKSGSLFQPTLCSHTSPPCKQNIIWEKSKRER